MYVVVYCGSALDSVILKRVVEEIITVSIKSPHFTATHITKEKFWAGQGGQVPPLDPPPPSDSALVYIAYAPPSIVGFKISYQAREKFSIKDDNYNKTRDSSLNKLKI